MGHDVDRALAEWGGKMERSNIPGLRLHHAASVCVLPCAIHKASDHPLAAAPLVWRADISLLERTCSHGVGHPDPDDLRFKKRIDPEAYAIYGYEMHGCDGCCHG